MAPTEVKITAKKNHRMSKVFMLLYMTWWFCFFYWFSVGNANNKTSCGTANGGLIVLTLFIVAIYTLLLAIQVVRFKKPARKYYLILLGIVWAPVLFVILYAS